ncbi:MAG: ATP-binding protein [Actinomycetota bacterium]
MSERRRGLSSRLLTVYAFAVLGLIGLFGALVDGMVRRRLLDELTASLTAQGKIVQVAISQADDPVPVVAALAGQIGARVTIISSDGRVVADSITDPTRFENHATRPEVVTALNGEVGVARRVSGSIGEPLLYVALPPQEGQIVRLALPEASVGESLTRFRLVVLVASLTAGLSGVLLVGLIARRIARPLQHMAQTSEAMAGGDLNARIRHSSVREFERLGRAINTMAIDLGARLQSSERQSRLLDQVLDAVRQGIVVIDESDEVLYSNPAAADLIRVPTTLTALTPHGLQTLVRQARSSGRLSQGSFDHGRPVRLLSVTATPFPTDMRVLLAITDITEASRVEAMRRDFVSAASHELKTPAAAILASSEALQLALAREPAAAVNFAEQLEKSARQLTRLVGDLLDLSRLESSVDPPEPVRLDQVVAEEAGKATTAAEVAGVTLAAELTNAEVRGSARDLGLAVRNLLENAIRHTSGGGRVDVRVGVADGMATVEVRDTGEGIPRRELPRIFERFYRVDSARARATGGTGLGLSIVRHIAERHGGSVEVESELGTGSTFRIRIPVM